MKRIFSPVSIAMALLASASYLLFAAVIPTQINYQGRLTDAQGNSVNGTVQMAVKLYSEPAGGTNALLYSETIGPVDVTNGVYRFGFGGGTNGINGTNGIAAALTATNHYLALVVDGAEQTNRTQLLAVPFAMKTLESETSADAQALALEVAALKLRLDYAEIPILQPLIPAGSFEMGNTLSVSGEGYNTELPVHTVNVSAFYMEKNLVTKELWDEVCAWGLYNGYTDLPVGGGKGVNHPVQTISWYAMVKWCNARRQKEGFTPCYTVSGSVYKTGDSAPELNMSVSGYRLPTEAEWEKAARGGLSGKRFPWGDTISQSEANYRGSTAYGYDLGPDGFNPTYNDGVYPYTSPVGSFGANGYGLYDMAGNVWEWCWDWYGNYAIGEANNPTGPVSGSTRVLRAGNWSDNPSDCRVSNRNYFGNPTISDSNIGFRCARSSAQ